MSPDTLRDRLGVDTGGTRLEDTIEWAARNQFHYLDFNADLGPNHIDQWDAARVGAVREACARHNLHLGLHTLRGEMLRGDPRILRRYAWSRRRRATARSGNHHAATAHAEIERLIELIAAFEEHIATADAEIRNSEFDVCRDVVRLQQQKAQTLCFAHQPPIIGKQNPGIDARP